MLKLYTIVLSVKTKFYEKSYILYSCVSNFHLEHKKNYSTYVVGSSKKITGGLLTSSKATDSRFNWPPDNLSDIVFL